jgi:hypothetical protein
MSKETPDKARLTLVLDLALFLSGVVTGWLIYPAPLFPRGAPPAARHSSIRGPQQFRSVKQLNSTLHALGMIDNPAALAEAVGELPTREIPPLLVLLTKRAGFDGLPRDDWRILRALLGAWHTRDSDQALAWALAWENPANRLPIMEVLVAAESEVDPVRAISLSHEYLVDDEGAVWLPDSAYEEALRRGMDTYLVCLKQSVHPAGTNHTPAMDFPEDFDFPRFAEKFAEHVNGLPDGLHQAVIPRNLPDEWARLDPAAAFKWTLQNPAAVSRGALYRVAELITQASPHEVGAFLHELREAGDTGPGDIHRGIIAVLNVKPDPEIFTQYLGFFDTPDEQHVQLLGIFHQSLHRLRRPERRIQRLILERIPAEERARFLLEIAARREADGENARLPERARKALERELASLGHPPAKIDAMLAHF